MARTCTYMSSLRPNRVPVPTLPAIFSVTFIFKYVQSLQTHWVLIAVFRQRSGVVFIGPPTCSSVALLLRPLVDSVTTLMPAAATNSTTGRCRKQRPLNRGLVVH